MNDESLRILSALAEKLGTPAEHLWSVLLKQAPISAATNIAIGAAWVAAAYAWYRFVKRKTSSTDDAYNSWSDGTSSIAWGSVFILAVLAAMFATIAFDLSVTAIANPEYWALRKLLGK